MEAPVDFLTAQASYSPGDRTLIAPKRKKVQALERSADESLIEALAKPKKRKGPAEVLYAQQ